MRDPSKVRLKYVLSRSPELQAQTVLRLLSDSLQLLWLLSSSCSQVLTELWVWRHLVSDQGADCLHEQVEAECR